MANVQINGLDRVLGRLRAMSRDIDGIVDSALKTSAEDICEKAKRNIQDMNVSYNGHIYDAKETGQLNREIHVEHLAPCQYAVGTAVKYAPFVEFGTGSAGDPSVPHTTRPKWVYFDTTIGEFRTAYPAPPRPFLRPAFTSYKDVILMNIRKALMKAVIE